TPPLRGKRIGEGRPAVRPRRTSAAAGLSRCPLPLSMTRQGSLDRKSFQEKRGSGQGPCPVQSAETPSVPASVQLIGSKFASTVQRVIDRTPVADADVSFTASVVNDTPVAVSPETTPPP